MQIQGPITDPEYRRWDVNLHSGGLYRDWKWSGDGLERHYEPAKKAFMFISKLDKYRTAVHRRRHYL